MTHSDVPWQERYASKITSAADAIRLIRPRQRILVGSGAAEPGRLVGALVEDGTHLEGNEIVHLLTLGPAPYVQPGQDARFHHTAFFIGANVREAVQSGRADITPVFLSEIPRLLRTEHGRPDVALIQVSPPDRHGCVSLGVSVDIVRAAIDGASLILAEVNPRMPRTHGDSFLDVDRIDRLVLVDEPLPELAPDQPDEVSSEIGRNVGRLIPDGATLQMGIGTIPNAVLRTLTHKHDLGVHTEMFSDGVMDLVEAGVITGRAKTLLPGKIVASFVIGSHKLYEWVHENPLVEMRPSQFTNDPFVIQRNDRMVAINAGLAVDLTGQVAADTLKGRFYSGLGGQVDFIRGSARSNGGVPVIALRSTALNGTVSRIQPFLEEGALVVTSRGDVHYVVTEFGAVDLWGRTIRQRAEALIGVAHPDFRAELRHAAAQRRLVSLAAPPPASIQETLEEAAELAGDPTPA